MTKRYSNARSSELANLVDFLSRVFFAAILWVAPDNRQTIICDLCIIATYQWWTPFNEKSFWYTTSDSLRIEILVGGWTFRRIWKNMLVKLDHFPRDEHQQIFELPPTTKKRVWEGHHSESLRYILDLGAPQIPPVTTVANFTTWWFQPLWKIVVKTGIFLIRV